jgi:2-amino-4-hydroxy-6-hydroxymethyldihydropteridine diphosphokinase
LSIGGNIGNSRKRFNNLILYLQRVKVLDVMCTSPILKNPPFGYKDQEFFFNAIIVVKTDLNPKMLLKFVLRVEKFFKRVRSFENSPRTLDIDIIFYDTITLNTKDLIIPHPEYHKRESVLIPLALINRRECL